MRGTAYCRTLRVAHEAKMHWREEEIVREEKVEELDRKKRLAGDFIMDFGQTFFSTTFYIF